MKTSSSGKTTTGISTPSTSVWPALSDAMLAQMARALGHDADAARYADRAQSYRHIFDPSTGFFRARDASGAFTGPADPAQSEGFHEGTSWQYQWLVPQDLPGMVGL